MPSRMWKWPGTLPNVFRQSRRIMFTPRPSAHLASVLPALLLVALLVGCDDPLEPEVELRPELLLLSVVEPREDKGFFTVRAQPANYERGLPATGSVPVSLSVSSGDEEQVGLRPMFCPDRRPPAEFFRCFLFQVELEHESAIDGVAREAAQVGGVLSINYSVYGYVVLFRPDDIVAHARRAGSWDGVRAARLIGMPGCMIGPCIAPGWLEIPVRVAVSPPVPGDGVVQVVSGDTVFARYQQPGGQVLEAWSVVP
jgi:hypothetical protein